VPHTNYATTCPVIRTVLDTISASYLKIQDSDPSAISAAETAIICQRRMARLRVALVKWVTGAEAGRLGATGAESRAGSSRWGLIAHKDTAML
jgi:hypothetical protein